MNRLQQNDVGVLAEWFVSKLQVWCQSVNISEHPSPVHNKTLIFNRIVNWPPMSLTIWLQTMEVLSLMVSSGCYLSQGVNNKGDVLCVNKVFQSSVWPAVNPWRETIFHLQSCHYCWDIHSMSGLFIYPCLPTFTPSVQSVSTGHRCCKLQVQQTNLRATDAQRHRVKLVLPNPPIHLLWKYFCHRTDHKAMEYINVLNLLTANYIASDSGIKGRC